MDAVPARVGQASLNKPTLLNKKVPSISGTFVTFSEAISKGWLEHLAGIGSAF